MKTILTGDIRPRTGDLVLARVDEIGKQAKLELTDGRRAHMFPGDEIVVCYGDRYAPDQYEAKIGPDLSPCDLVAAGGLASVEISRRAGLRPPTQITPIGLIGNAEGQRLNVMQFRVDAQDHTPEIPAILSLGTSMNAGKTLAATSMVRGFKRLGLKVAALKITGTGAGGDMWIVRDAGADVSLDFTDAGYASTYLIGIPEIESATYRLLNHAAALGCDVAVIEIADGLQQLETSQLIRSQKILNITVGTVFSAYDAMGAKYGVDVLRAASHSVMGISGRLGRSPLGVREAEHETGLRVYSPWDLQDGALLPLIRERAAEASAKAESPQPLLNALARMKITPHIALGNVSPIGAEAGNAQFFGFSGVALARKVLERACHHVMQIDADGLCGAGFGSHAATRHDWRNGFHLRQWDTDFGVIELRVPRLKRNRYSPLFAEKPTAPVAAVKAVIDAPADGFVSAVSSLVAAMTKTRLVPGLLDDVVAELRGLIDHARAQALPQANHVGAGAWPTPPANEDEAWDDDELLEDASGLVGGSAPDRYIDDLCPAFQLSRRVTAAE